MSVPATADTGPVAIPLDTWKGGDHRFPFAEDTNPYRAPLASTVVADDPDPAAEAKHEPEVEAMLLRAWRASVIGFFFLPLILHLYSMVLLMVALKRDPHFSPTGTRRFYQSWALNVVAGLVWGSVIAYMSA